jgi:HopA1 effector protein family
LADPISTNGIVVLKALVPKLNVLDGFQKVKMFGPIQGRNRNDNIVAYCTTPAAQNAVATAVVNLGPNCVLPDIPNFVHRVGPGVGIADEPPQVAVIREEKKKSQSFGKFLSKLIYAAWETYKQKQKTSEREFLELVEVALQTARINPDAPHEHPERAALENMGPEFANTLKSALSRFADQRPIRPFRSAG